MTIDKKKLDLGHIKLFKIFPWQSWPHPESCLTEYLPQQWGRIFPAWGKLWLDQRAGERSVCQVQRAGHQAARDLCYS